MASPCLPPKGFALATRAHPRPALQCLRRLSVLLIEGNLSMKRVGEPWGGQLEKLSTPLRRGGRHPSPLPVRWAGGSLLVAWTPLGDSTYQGKGRFDLVGKLAPHARSNLPARPVVALDAWPAARAARGLVSVSTSGFEEKIADARLHFGSTMPSSWHQPYAYLLLSKPTRAHVASA